MTHLANDYGRVDKVRICPVAPEENPWRQRSRVQNGFGTANQAWNFTSGHIYQGSYGINGWLYLSDNPYSAHDPKKGSAANPPSLSHPGLPFSPILSGFSSRHAQRMLPPGTFMKEAAPPTFTNRIQRLTIARHGRQPRERAPEPPSWSAVARQHQYHVLRRPCPERETRGPLVPLLAQRLCSSCQQAQVMGGLREARAESAKVAADATRKANR